MWEREKARRQALLYSAQVQNSTTRGGSTPGGCKSKKFTEHRGNDRDRLPALQLKFQGTLASLMPRPLRAPEGQGPVIVLVKNGQFLDSPFATLVATLEEGEIYLHLYMVDSDSQIQETGSDSQTPSSKYYNCSYINLGI